MAKKEYWEGRGALVPCAVLMVMQNGVTAVEPSLAVPTTLKIELPWAL